MQNKVAIVTDSTAYLPQNHIKAYSIAITRLSVIWGDQVYLDGVDIQPDQFYERLAESRAMPTTSQVSPAAMQSAFRSLLEQGFDVLGIFLSSRISGTVQSALQARDMIPDAAGKIAILDSLWTTMALGMPVLTAARAAHAGEGLAECEKIAKQACANTGVLFVVETLEFMRRGGRIGGAQAFLGTVLNIKPVLEMRDGRIEPVEKVRTRKRAIQYMLDVIAGRLEGKSSIRLAVTHAHSDADAQSLLEAACARLDPVETFCCPLSPVIGSHVGPGTLALNYMSGIP